MKAFALRINKCGERFKRGRELLWLPSRSIVRGHFEGPALGERPHIFYRSPPIPEFATPSACWVGLILVCTGVRVYAFVQLNIVSGDVCVDFRCTLFSKAAFVMTKTFTYRMI